MASEPCGLNTSSDRDLDVALDRSFASNLQPAASVNGHVPQQDGGPGTSSVADGREAVDQKEKLRQMVTHILRSELGNKQQLVDDGFEHGYAAYLAKSAVEYVGQPALYIAKCARNWIWKDLKRQRRSGHIQLDQEQVAVLLDLQEEVSAVESSAADRSVSYALHDCVQKLPADSQFILRQRYVAESPMAEIAPSVGMSEGALRVALHRVRQQLKECLESKLGKIK